MILRQIPMTPFKMMYAPRGPVCDLGDLDTVRALLGAARDYGIKNKAYTFKIDTDTLASNTEYIDALKDMGFNFKEHGTGFDTIQARYIFRLNVEGKTEEEVMASFHPKTRYNTRLAARKGVTVEIKGIEACEEFHELMLITGERDSFATRDTSYFERIMNAFGDDARIYLAKYEGKTIAGALDVHCGDKVWYVYGASSNEYRNVHAELPCAVGDDPLGDSPRAAATMISGAATPMRITPCTAYSNSKRASATTTWS